MADLRIHQSNRLERLADLLAEFCRRPLASPFEPERVVVPNAGMARWLSLRLADRLGVCTNVSFELPASFVWSVWKQVLDHVPDEPGFSASLLTWRIFALLERVADEPVFRPLSSHLDAADDLRRFELAEHIAEVFDQYLVYRPEMIVGWEEGRVSYPPETRDENWQAELWRRLVGTSRPRHRARLALEFGRVSDARLAAARVPERVQVFGIPALAPMHLETLRRLAGVADVDLFVVNPCRQYWEEILPASDIARRSGEVDPAELFFETGNPLLASMGRQGRDFVAMLGELQAHGTESFDDPLLESAPRMLDVLQGDILDLRHRGEEATTATVPDDDRSIQIHACHSPMREVEVLHDRLLDLFRTHPDLEPSQVRVMTPDIESYAPLIDSVFGTTGGHRRIPYAIADRQPRAERSTVAAFLALLELPHSRFDAVRLLSLLETEAVRQRYDLEEGDLPRLAHWVRVAGIRWGIDAAHRATLGLPTIEENTWRFGLDRLMLGHAMAGNGERLFDGILPCDDVEGAEVRLMAQLDRFAEDVFDAARELARPRPAQAWQDVLDGLLARFFAGGSADEDIETIRQAVQRLVDESGRAECADDLSLPLVLRGLDRLLRQPGGAWAFLSGSVTFCTMVPMRNIPAEVVCLLGMNDDSYPRSRRPPGFDLVSRHPANGDRSRRDDDRYLFLEALLSARNTFYVSYVGRSIRDNSEIPPSILVSELTDVVGSSCGRDVVTTHPLQPFSPRYFTGDTALFSYAHELCDAAEASRAAETVPPTVAPAFLSSELSAPDEPWRTVRLDALLRFYRDPTKYFLRDRLGILLEETESLIESNEPFKLESLDRYQVRERLMALALAGRDPADLRRVVRASGALPHGLVGERALENLGVQVDRVARLVGPLLSEAELPPETIDAAFGDIRLVGALRGLSRAGLIEYGFGEANGRDHLALWIRHLALNLIAPTGVERRSRRVSDESILEFGPVGDAGQSLTALLALYWRGLREPLQLFPDLSIECARGGRDDVELSDLVKPWNAYPALAFRGKDPGDGEFVRLAHEVFTPLLDSVVHT